MRCFIALEIPDHVKTRISGLIGSLKPLSRAVRWVRPENVHLTLKFLGEVPERLLPDINEAIAKAVSGHEPFALSARGTGAFPSKSRPRVVWAGLVESNGLMRLHEDIERAMERLGFIPENREFRAHLTIGRVKGSGGLSGLMRELESHAEVEFGKFEAGEIVLMKSDLLPSGAVYSVLSAFRLG